MSEYLRTSQIRTDGGTQARAGLDKATVAEYEQAIKDASDEADKPAWPFPPIDVYHDGENYWLADGFHRIAAAEKLLHFQVPATVHQGEKRDAILHAAGANADHGLRRTAEDKRRAVRRLLEDEEWGQWSDREIARRCKVSPTFVGGLRKDVTVQMDSDDGERKYVTKHGTEAVMKTAGIGKAAEQELDPWVVLPGEQGPQIREKLDLWANSMPTTDYVIHMLANKESRDHRYYMDLAIKAMGTSEMFIWHQAMVLENRLMSNREQEPKEQPATPPQNQTSISELKQKIQAFYISERLNDIPGQLQLMEEIQKQQKGHPLYKKLFSHLPDPETWNWLDLTEAIVDSVEYLQERTNELEGRAPIYSADNYAQIWQLEAHVRQWLPWRTGGKDIAKHIEVLGHIKARRGDDLTHLEGWLRNREVTLRIGDLRQACNNVLNQLEDAQQEAVEAAEIEAILAEPEEDGDADPRLEYLQSTLGVIEGMRVDTDHDAERDLFFALNNVILAMHKAIEILK